jgi:hypothetical protein
MTEAVSAVAMADSAREVKQVRTVVWVSLALVGLLFASTIDARRLFAIPKHAPGSHVCQLKACNNQTDPLPRVPRAFGMGHQ